MPYSFWKLRQDVCNGIWFMRDDAWDATKGARKSITNTATVLAVVVPVWVMLLVVIAFLAGMPGWFAVGYLLTCALSILGWITNRRQPATPHMKPATA